jgi:hypothetical protein
MSNRMWAVAQRTPAGWFEFAALPAKDADEAICHALDVSMRDGRPSDFRARHGTVPIGLMPANARGTPPSFKGWRGQGISRAQVSRPAVLMLIEGRKEAKCRNSKALYAKRASR